MSAALTHQRAMELIPWLVNDTLDAHERAALERHVHDCLACRAELKEQRALAELVGTQHAPHLAPDTGFDALMARADRRRRKPRARHYAIAASVAVVVLGALAVLVAPSDDGGSPGYETLSPPGDTGTRLDLVFAPEVTEAEMRAIVRGVGGTIVAGPSGVGRYTVELGEARDSDALERTIVRLEHDARVRFAGRSFMPSETP